MEPFIIFSYKPQETIYGRCGDSNDYIDAIFKMAIYDDVDQAASYIAKLNTNLDEEQQRGADEKYRHEIVFAKQVQDRVGWQIDEFSDFWTFHSPDNDEIEFGKWEGLSELREQILEKAQAEDGKLRRDREERARIAAENAKKAAEEKKKRDAEEAARRREEQERVDYERLKLKFEGKS